LSSPLRIGTRGSPLALAQANWVKSRLEEGVPGVQAVLRVIVTSGDRFGGNLSRLGGKGLFVKEIEEALLDGRVDLAVHSMKDLPAVVPDGLAVSAIPTRADPRDVVMGLPAGSEGLSGLPAGARVGTASLRRRAQLLAARPDTTIVEIRGNVDTRLRRCVEGVCDAVIVAAAGLDRLGIGIQAGTALDPETFVPAVGQGALALQTRAGDDELRHVVSALNDEDAWRAVGAERAFLTALGGDCVTPIAGHAVISGGVLHLTGLVASIDGTELLRDTASGVANTGNAVGETLASRLRARGADELLARVRAAMNR
jgi:hydroxymethylbilane synthase